MAVHNPLSTPGFVATHGLSVAAYALVFVGLCALFWPFTADDAFIVGRYAMNAAAGEGLVYNVGERVSALTSPLHALLETVFALFGLDPVQTYRLVAPGLVLAGWLVAIRETGLRGPGLLLFTALSLFSPFLALWSVGGLETALLSCLATMFTARLVRMYRRGTASGPDYLWLGILIGLMFLTRHDSILVTAPIALAVAWVERRRPALWIGAAIGFSLAASWLVFAWLYYGDILPTSYYVKFDFGGRAPIDSLSALLNFALLSGLAVVALALSRGGDASLSPLSKAIRYGAAIAAILFVVYASRASGQHMMFGYRLFVPYLMSAALLATLALGRPQPALAGLLVGHQVVMAALVQFGGVNPAPLTRLPGLDRAYTEYQWITPAKFGQLREMLQQDARDIAEHWAATGREGPPSIYLRTGGMGYFMPEFHVYETLVSYRHACGAPMGPMIDASHYMQQLDFSLSGTLVEDRGRQRPDIADDAALLFLTDIGWSGPDGETGYLYGPAPIALDLGTRIDAPCRFADRVATAD